MFLKRHARLQAPDDETPEGGTDVLEQPEDQTEGEATTEQPEVEELTVSIGDPEPEEEEKHAPGWVKELRKENREKAKKLKEYEAELQRLKGGQAAPEPLKKPKIEDYDFDSDAYEQAMDKYYAAKSEQDKAEEKRKQDEEERQKEWKARQDTYEEAKKRFPVEDMEEAEMEVISVLSPARQAMLLDVADDPASLVLALGKSPEVLRKIAGIKSDGQAIKEMLRIEMNIKVTPKGYKPPPPERTISGSGKTAGVATSNLEKLREEARVTGNYDKYFAEKRRQGK